MPTSEGSSGFNRLRRQSPNETLRKPGNGDQAIRIGTDRARRALRLVLRLSPREGRADRLGGDGAAQGVGIRSAGSDHRVRASPRGCAGPRGVPVAPADAEAVGNRVDAALERDGVYRVGLLAPQDSVGAAAEGTVGDSRFPSASSDSIRTTVRLIGLSWAHRWRRLL